MNHEEILNDVENVSISKVFNDITENCVEELETKAKVCEMKGEETLTFANETIKYCEKLENSANSEIVKTLMIKPDITRDEFLFESKTNPKVLYNKQIIALQQASQNLHMLENEKKEINKVKSKLEELKIEIDNSNCAKQTCQSVSKGIIKEAKETINKVVKNKLALTRKKNKTIRLVLGIASILASLLIMPMLGTGLSSLISMENIENVDSLFESLIFTNVKLNGFAIFATPLCLLAFIVNGIRSKIRLSSIRSKGLMYIKTLENALEEKSEEIEKDYHTNYLNKVKAIYKNLESKAERIIEKKTKEYNEHYELYKNVIISHYPPSITNLEVLDKTIELMLNGFAIEYREANSRAMRLVNTNIDF